MSQKNILYPQFIHERFAEIVCNGLPAQPGKLTIKAVTFPDWSVENNAEAATVVNLDVKIRGTWLSVVSGGNPRVNVSKSDLEFHGHYRASRNRDPVIWFKRMFLKSIFDRYDDLPVTIQPLYPVSHGNLEIALYFDSKPKGLTYDKPMIVYWSSLVASNDPIVNELEKVRKTHQTVDNLKNGIPV